MLNAEKYRNEIQKILDSYNSLAIEKGTNKLVACNGAKCDNCALNQENRCSILIERWLISEYKEPILTESEKEYLSAVIKPFKEEVTMIVKTSSHDCEKINIQSATPISDSVHIDLISLPPFKKGTMYKNMVANKNYTLEELGL